MIGDGGFQVHTKSMCTATISGRHNVTGLMAGFPKGLSNEAPRLELLLERSPPNGRRPDEAMP